VFIYLPEEYFYFFFLRPTHFFLMYPFLHLQHTKKKTKKNHTTELSWKNVQPFPSQMIHPLCFNCHVRLNFLKFVALIKYKEGS